MSKYRKKPIVIEAFKFGEGVYPDWFYKSAGNEWNNESFVIRTLEGDMSGVAGDYIIKGIADEIYPCKPEIFEATYEKME